MQDLALYADERDANGILSVINERRSDIMELAQNG
jgi:hypothetical protein